MYDWIMENWVFLASVVFSGSAAAAPGIWGWAVGKRRRRLFTDNFLEAWQVGMDGQMMADRILKEVRNGKQSLQKAANAVGWLRTGGDSK